MKSLKRAVFALVCFCAMNTGLFAQAPVSASVEDGTAIERPEKAEIGTFELVRSAKGDVLIHDEILVMIQNARDEHEVTFLQIGENVQARILPWSEILAEEFEPLEKLFADE